MTRINPDDPKWTAYVLGELDDSERAAVEAELEKSEEARMLVEELRFAADLTKTELRESVAVTPLTGADREKIRAEARALKPRRWFGVRMPIWATGFALAGVVAIGFAVILTPAYKSNLVPFAPSEATTAKATTLQVVPARGRIDVSDAPYFADYVQNQLGDMIAGNGATQHLRIYTTIDMDLQRAAYAALTKQLAALDKVQAKRFEPGTLQAALVAMNAKTGEIVAMVGGRDYSKSQLNRAADALRQPGSVFKPFVYATALNTAYDPVPRVITPATTYMDEPKTFTYDNQEYSPGNFGETYSHEPVTLREGLVHSLNVVTVEVAMEVTIGRVMTLAAKAGLPRPGAAVKVPCLCRCRKLAPCSTPLPLWTAPAAC